VLSKGQAMLFAPDAVMVIEPEQENPGQYQSTGSAPRRPLRALLPTAATAVDKPAIRRALLSAINQDDLVVAASGHGRNARLCFAERNSPGLGFGRVTHLVGGSAPGDAAAS